MASVRLKIEGKAGTISLKTLVTSIQSELNILADLDSAVSGEGKPTLKWVVTGLELGSIGIVANALSRLPNQDYSPQVSDLFVTGLSQIQVEGASPPFFSDFGLRNAKRLLGTIGSNGATGLEVADDSGTTVKLSKRAAENAANLIPARYTSIGSVEGRMKVISIQGTKPKCLVYLARTNKAVTCLFKWEDWMERVKDALGRRVIVTGLVKSNARGEPIRVEQIENLRVLPQEHELPGIDDIRGIAPQFTGGLASEEYVRRLRVG